jgi:non-specific serine/threonine protein kinase
MGKRIGNRFEIQGLLGRGGMGEVYRATDTQTGERVAVKALHPEILERDPSFLERFVREGEALRQLNHPNIVRIIAAVQEQGQHYLIVEYVSGGSLADRLAAQGRLPSRRVIEIALDVADALTRAHRLGIIHRDLKPANVLLAEDGTPRLADFGIAHVESDRRLTQTGVLMGTIDYLSPEVCQGEPPDERSDIWAFGVMLFQMLSGRLPFEGASLTARLTAILTQPVPDLAQLAPDVPAALIDLVYRMLAKDRQQRIPSARLVGADLEAMLKGREPATPPRTTPTPSAHVPRHNLPAHLSKFIGRDKEIALVKQKLTEYRLVTLTGSGGVGKTRLAIQVARGVASLYPGGVWLVELAPLSDPALVPQAAATVFALQEEAGRPMLMVLTDYLQDKILLMILDNCEHVIDAGAQLVEHLLTHCPQIRVLTSSREALGIEGEAAVRVPSLSLPPAEQATREILVQSEAVQLFDERARATAPNFVLTDVNAPAIAQICRRLDGIPLAIELAAARVRLLRVEQIAARLDDAFRLLTGGSRTALPRQQTLRALIDWSYNLVSAAERVLLQRLSVFAGGWTLEAAEMVCSDDDPAADVSRLDVLDLLTQLVNKSLVVVEREPGQEARYRLLETIRQYARDRLLDAHASELVRDRHLAFFAHWVENLTVTHRQAEPTIWANQLMLEHDNLRAALQWALDTQIETGVRLLAGLIDFWTMRGVWDEGLDWCRRFFAAPETPANTPFRVQALARAGQLAAFKDELVEAQAWCDAGLRLGKEINDQAGVALACYMMGRIAALTPTSLRDAPTGLRDAQRWYNEALEIARSIEDKPLMASALTALGDSMLVQDPAQARRYYEEGLQVARSAGLKSRMPWPLGGLGVLALNDGNLDQARNLLEASLAYLRQQDVKSTRIWALSNLVETTLRQGDHRAALSYLNEAKDIDRSLNSKVWERNYLPYEAMYFVWATHEYDRAAQVCQECYQLAKEKNDRELMFSVLAQLVECAVASGRVESGMRLLGALEAADQHVGILTLPVSRSDLDRYFAMARQRLDEAAISSALAEGRSMMLEQAIEHALEENAR